MEYDHSGEVREARNAEEAIAACPWLSSMPMEEAVVFVELAATGKEIIADQTSKRPDTIAETTTQRPETEQVQTDDLNHSIADKPTSIDPRPPDLLLTKEHLVAHAPVEQYVAQKQLAELMVPKPESPVRVLLTDGSPSEKKSPITEPRKNELVIKFSPEQKPSVPMPKLNEILIPLEGVDTNKQKPVLVAIQPKEPKMPKSPEAIKLAEAPVEDIAEPSEIPATLTPQKPEAPTYAQPRLSVHIAEPPTELSKKPSPQVAEAQALSDEVEPITQEPEPEPELKPEEDIWIEDLAVSSGQLVEEVPIKIVEPETSHQIILSEISESTQMPEQLASHTADLLSAMPETVLDQLATHRQHAETKAITEIDELIIQIAPLAAQLHEMAAGKVPSNESIEVEKKLVETYKKLLKHLSIDATQTAISQFIEVVKQPTFASNNIVDDDLFEDSLHEYLQKHKKHFPNLFSAAKSIATATQTLEIELARLMVRRSTAISQSI